MNAYELAKLLEVDSWYKLVSREEIATTLRQQAERIAELEKFIKAILKKGGCDGNICKRYDTHPVKQLSDKEILNICWQKGITWYKLSDGNMDEQMMIEFARAIIKEITDA